MTVDSIVKDKVQKRILEVLLEESRKNPTGFGVHRSDMKKALNVPERHMDFNMFYLRKRNYVNFVQVPNFHWLWAKITGPGMDAIETTLYYEQQLGKIEIGGQK